MTKEELKQKALDDFEKYRYVTLQHSLWVKDMLENIWNVYPKKNSYQSLKNYMTENCVLDEALDSVLSNIKDNDTNCDLIDENSVRDILVEKYEDKDRYLKMYDKLKAGWYDEVLKDYPKLKNTLLNVPIFDIDNEVSDAFVEFVDKYFAENFYPNVHKFPEHITNVEIQFNERYSAIEFWFKTDIDYLMLFEKFTETKEFAKFYIENAEITKHFIYHWEFEQNTNGSFDEIKKLLRENIEYYEKCFDKEELLKIAKDVEDIKSWQNNKWEEKEEIER